MIMNPEIALYCHRWSKALDDITAEKDRMAYFQEQLPSLLLDRAAVEPVLENMANGRPWPDLRDPGLFIHEILLYLDPGRRYSLRLYLHPPNDHTVIHDHTSWGISGCPAGRLSGITYRLAEQTGNDRVVLARRAPIVLSPEQVTVTLPWDQGIHQTGSPDDDPIVMISVYGRPGRRLYVNTYDLQTGQVTRRYLPKLLRRMLAKESLVLFR
jgi:predicted metal-dependent enzyme (double-stranded beta helix superfamily)